MEEIGLASEEPMVVEPVEKKVKDISEIEDAPAKETAVGDLYIRMKELERELEFIAIQETYIKDEQKNLKRELLRAQEEVKRIQSVPLVIGQFLEMVDENTGIIGATTGSNGYVRILRFFSFFFFFYFLIVFFYLFFVKFVFFLSLLSFLISNGETAQSTGSF